MNRNYQKELEAIIAYHQERKEIPSLFLHSCCAPCSSYVLEYLSEFFRITVFYYNPNIYPEEEYRKRVEEQKSFIEQFPAKNPIRFVEGAYESARFYEMAKGLENVPEGGERCFLCYELRLREAAEYAKAENMDYFTTTLSISPLKNAQKLNEIGLMLEKEYGVKYLVSDFKKKNGYQRSVELSREYGMYRQDYCGCVFSRQQREREKDELFMREAIRLSNLAVQHGNEPFGAVLVKDNKIAAIGENQIYTRHDPTYHAEAGLIRQFCADTGITDLSEYTLYSSCEPCFMCCGALVWAKLGRLVYGASDRELCELLGVQGSECCSIVFSHSGNRIEVTGGVLREESLQVLRNYFKNHGKG